MPDFSIEWSQEARLDFEKIRAWFNEHAPWYTAQLVHDIEKSLWPLPEHPFFYRRSKYLKGCRDIIVGKYIMLYLVDADHETIRILRILHGARNIANVLQDGA